MSDTARLSIQRYPSGAALLDLDPELLCGLATRLVGLVGDGGALRSFFRTEGHGFYERDVMRALLALLLRLRLPWSDAGLAELVDALVALRRSAWNGSGVGVLRAVEAHVGEVGLSSLLDQALGRLLDTFSADYRLTEPERRLRDLLLALRARAAPQPDRDQLSSLLRGRDAWSVLLREGLAEMSGEARANWLALLEHSGTAQAAKPSKAWLAEASRHLAAVGNEAFGGLAGRCLAAVGARGEEPVRSPKGIEERTLLDERDSDLLRGLVWTASLVPEHEVIAGIGRAAQAAFQKLRDHGPRSVKVGNACLVALSRMGALAAVAELGRLASQVKHPSGRRQVGKALEEAARSQGMSPADLEDLATPVLGLQEVGIRRQGLGGVQAELETDGSRVTLVFRTSSGKVQKSIPAATRAAFPAEVASLKQATEEVRRLLPALRARLERLYLAPRHWNLAAWRARYSDHPLMGTLARRLIWRVGPAGAEDGRLVHWHDGTWMSGDGQAPTLAETDLVQLWHPIESPAATVHAWRTRLEEHRITQPFKQAHREIYVLTDAERLTRKYSNRFAAHILRQHQFVALARERGWSCPLQGWFDVQGLPTLTVPQGDLSVQYCVSPAGEERSESGIALYVATDHVRFVDRAGEPQPLETIPALPFSEAMRDVDLFVGVASIGTDPGWADQGDSAFTTYWGDFAFGELGTMAQERREILLRLLPRLSIAAQCDLEDRFLRVRGKFGTYKIHLGSGNVRRSPSDRYLCIVPDPRRNSGPSLPSLPFEGDAMLGVVLSKAFLLAADDRITDPLILSQLRD